MSQETLTAKTHHVEARSGNAFTFFQLGRMEIVVTDDL
jgi:hypothetical protein